MQDSPAQRWVLRIFNGPLQGCEFQLTERRTLFVVGSQGRFCDQEHPLSVPADAIYVPLERDGLNFEIHIKDNVDNGVFLRVLAEDAADERVCKAQCLESVGGLRFALRADDETWDESVLNSAAQPQPQPVPGSILSPAAFPRWGMGLAGVVVFALIAGAWYLTRPNPVDDIQALIAGAGADYVVLRGSDHRVYVFAASERDANWGRQVLARNPVGSSTRLMTPNNESQRLEWLLLDAEPALAYHRIDLSDPAVPRLLVSNQRNLLTPALHQRLTQTLLKAAPYARDVVIEGRDDWMLARQAEQGLERLAVPYHRQVGPDGVTFSLEGSLQDTEIEAVRAYVSGFYQQWGDRYVHFAIELKDDWLKGKSFQYGPNGYVKMAPSSWYFPKPI